MILFSFFLSLIYADLGDILIENFSDSCRTKNESSYNTEMNEIESKIKNIENAISNISDDCRALLTDFSTENLKNIYDNKLQNEIDLLEAKRNLQLALSQETNSSEEENTTETIDRELELKRLELEYQYSSESKSKTAQSFQTLKSLGDNLQKIYSNPKCSENQKNAAAAQNAMVSASSLFLSLPVTNAISQGFQLFNQISNLIERKNDNKSFANVNRALKIHQISCVMEHFNHKFCKAKFSTLLESQGFQTEGSSCLECDINSKNQLKKISDINNAVRSIEDILSSTTNILSRTNSFMGISNPNSSLTDREITIKTFLSSNGIENNEGLSSFLAIHSDAGLSLSEIPDKKRLEKAKPYFLALNTELDNGSKIVKQARGLIKDLKLDEEKNSFLSLITKNKKEKKELEEKLANWKKDYQDNGGELVTSITADSLTLYEFLSRAMPNSKYNIKQQIDSAFKDPKIVYNIQKKFNELFLNVIYDNNISNSLRNKEKNKGITLSEYRTIVGKFQNIQQFLKETDISNQTNFSKKKNIHSFNANINETNKEEISFQIESMFSSDFNEELTQTLKSLSEMQEHSKRELLRNPKIPIYQVFYSINERSSAPIANLTTLGHLEAIWEGFINASFSSFKNDLSSYSENLDEYSPEVKKHICFNLNGFSNKKDIPKELKKLCHSLSLPINEGLLSFTDYISLPIEQRSCIYSQYYDQENAKAAR